MKHQMDARRLLCPLPVIRTQDKVATLAAGDVLEVKATDRGVLNDIPAWCRINGHQVLDTQVDKGEVTIILQVGGKE